MLNSLPVVHENRPARSVIAAGAVVLASGTFGYMWIEGWTLADAAYMTVITLSTVGFGEVREMSPAGRAFTIGLILGGVATLSYAVAALGEQIPKRREHRHRRRMRHMNDHVIICGFARMAQQLVDRMVQRNQDFCVIDSDPAKVRELRERNIPAVEGDATLESVLDRAGLARAATLAAVLPSDPDNLSIAMSATGVHPGIRILARSERERSRANLLRAGVRAEDIISPHASAGTRLLQNFVNPEGAEVFSALHELVPRGLEVTRRTVNDDDALVGSTVADVTGAPGQRVLVMAIERVGAERNLAPHDDQQIRSGDTLVLLQNARRR